MESLYEWEAWLHCPNKKTEKQARRDMVDMIHFEIRRRRLEWKRRKSKELFFFFENTFLNVLEDQSITFEWKENVFLTNRVSFSSRILKKSARLCFWLKVFTMMTMNESKFRWLIPLPFLFRFLWLDDYGSSLSSIHLFNSIFLVPPTHVLCEFSTFGTFDPKKRSNCISKGRRRNQ